MSLTPFFSRPDSLGFLRDMDDMWEDLGKLQHRHSSLVPKMSCDVTEGKDSFTVRAELPGVTKDMISINVDRDLLTIQAEKEERRVDDSDTRHVRERSYGRVSRSFRLPSGTDVNSSQCTFENGELVISFKKNPEQTSARKIEIL